MNKIEKKYEEAYAILSDMPFNKFVSVLLVMLERKCAECRINVIEVAQAIPAMVEAVNSQLGSF